MEELPRASYQGDLRLLGPYTNVELKDLPVLKRPRFSAAPMRVAGPG